MANAIRFHEIGTPSVMRWEEIEVGRPGAGEVRVRHEAVGLNFADTYFRSGLYPAQLPAGMGVEGAGVVEEIGEGVVDFAVGDRVTYTGSPLGAYATERIMASSDLIALPDGIAFRHRGRHDHARTDCRLPSASHLPVESGRHRVATCCGGRGWTDLHPVGKTVGNQSDRNGVERREGERCPSSRVR